MRDFSDQPVPREVIEFALLAAGTAPSGANLQPWHFTVITDPDTKRRIRDGGRGRGARLLQRPGATGMARCPGAARHGRAQGVSGDRAGADRHLRPAVERGPTGDRVKNYYVPESVGIATGFLIAALHGAGLVTLTHTPSPMGFLNDICGRPETEKPYILLVVGYPAED